MTIWRCEDVDRSDGDVPSKLMKFMNNRIEIYYKSNFDRTCIKYQHTLSHFNGMCVTRYIVIEAA